MRACSTAVLIAALAFALAACGGEERLVATFTSDVVQRESCRVVRSGSETCTREEVTQRLRVTLVEDEKKRAVLYGIPRAGGSDRAILGSADSQGGWLFSDERVQENTATGCVLTELIVLSLRVDEDADAEAVGVDDCVALVGRETRTTATSEACDEVNDPPQPIQRIVRRRWQRAPGCEP